MYHYLTTSPELITRRPGRRSEYIANLNYIPIGSTPIYQDLINIERSEYMTETWNPAEISEDIKPVNYVNADSWNSAELNEAINLFGIKYPVDTWNPAALDEKAQNIINDITSLRTISGNPISFKTINGGYAKSCVVSFSPIQSGSGEPSPKNVRPISGRDSLHLYQDTEQTETPETTHTATFPYIVYGGKIDLVSGKVTVEYALIKLNSLTWNFNEHQSYGQYFYASISGVKYEGSFYSIVYNALCNKYAIAIRTVDKFINNKFTFDGTSTEVTQIQIKDSTYSTKEGFAASLTDNDVLVYKLVAPTEITLTAEQIALLKGNNVMWTDGDDITLKFTKLALPDDSDGLSLTQKVKKAIELIKGKSTEETKKSTTKGRRKKS